VITHKHTLAYTGITHGHIHTHTLGALHFLFVPSIVFLILRAETECRKTPISGTIPRPLSMRCHWIDEGCAEVYSWEFKLNWSHFTDFSLNSAEQCSCLNWVETSRPQFRLKWLQFSYSVEFKPWTEHGLNSSQDFRLKGRLKWREEPPEALWTPSDPTNPKNLNPKPWPHRAPEKYEFPYIRRFVIPCYKYTNYQHLLSTSQHGHKWVTYNGTQYFSNDIAKSQGGRTRRAHRIKKKSTLTSIRSRSGHFRRDFRLNWTYFSLEWTT
jgi:hypothetical protein